MDGGEEQSEDPTVRVMYRAGSRSQCQDGPERYVTFICPADGTRVHKRFRCEAARGCPRCVYQWANGEGKKAAWRLKKLRLKRGFRLPPRHVIVSFHWGFGGDDPLGVDSYDRMFRKAAEVLRSLGALGGCLVAHGWRHQPKGAHQLLSYWSWGPHVHAMYWGKLEGRVPPGIIVKVKRREQTTISGTLGYLLNHCAVIDKKHSLRWYGVATYRGTPGLETAPREPLRPFCPMCGREMERELLDTTGGYGRPEAVPWDPGGIVVG